LHLSLLFSLFAGIFTAETGSIRTAYSVNSTRLWLPGLDASHRAYVLEIGKIVLTGEGTLLDKADIQRAYLGH
jgi:hypothetical protein